jgi:hypothetical protein
VSLAVRRAHPGVLVGLTVLGLGLVGLVLLAGPARRASATSTPVARRTGVHDVKISLRAGTTGTDVLISWAPPTAEQRRGLTWTSVYFGTNPQPILVFPPETDVTVPDVAPGRYRLGVELDYGPRSSYTGSTRYRASVTVPRDLPASTPAATGRPRVVAPSAPDNGGAVARLVPGAGRASLLVTSLLAAALLAVVAGLVAVRRRGRSSR